jgi:hypothetical protein
VYILVLSTPAIVTAPVASTIYLQRRYLEVIVAQSDSVGSKQVSLYLDVPINPATLQNTVCNPSLLPK